MDVLKPPTVWLNGVCYRKVELPPDLDIDSRNYGEGDLPRKYTFTS